MPASQNALGPESLVKCMSESLTSQSSSGKLLKDPYAAIALFAHACMSSVGFRLIGLGEDHKIGIPILDTIPEAIADRQVEAHSDPEEVKTLPAEWDRGSIYAFRYAHAQSSMEYLIKISRLGQSAILMGVGLGDDKTASFEVKAQDYISEGSISEFSLESDKVRSLTNVFISTGRISDLSKLFKINIIQKLAPGISKEGYEEERERIEERREAEQQRQPMRNPLRDDSVPEPARPYPFDDPLAAQPRRPIPAGDFPPPGFEDEYEINRPPRGGIGGYRPPNLGERDLYPPGLGPHDPLRIGPGGIGGGGGMHPTFDDPLFGGNGGVGGADLRAPPGSRYDPVGPGDGPPNLRGGPRFPGGRGGGGGSGGNPFGGFGSGDFI
ncbi:putative pi31 proteasome regulator [Phaeomoniella chlamydospora]|uniref:Putative pi31 proteasome regulator n=1 Tax=Phaeomoniella chlamydospora TaxID=158046 RepID=A0A0G2EQH2_PHACM|nr:putative pi31 proteasome regulator [Phaeomoniella chlamydospora]